MAHLDQDTFCQFIISYDKTKNIFSPSSMCTCIYVHMHKHVIANVHSHTGTKRNLHTDLSCNSTFKSMLSMLHTSRASYRFTVFFIAKLMQKLHRNKIITAVSEYGSGIRCLLPISGTIVKIA